MKQRVAPKGRKSDIVVQNLNGEVLIYDLKSNKAFCLNETSAFVWQACDGEKSIDEISQSISKKLNQPSNEDLVWLALDQLKKENLLENSEEIVSNFGGMSRREVIKKVGIGTMIALPVVASLVAPTAAMAQSAGGAPNGTIVGTRTTNGDDCGGTVADQTVRADRCDATFSGACASGNATFVPGTCTYNAQTNQSTFQCRCTA